MEKSLIKILKAQDRFNKILALATSIMAFEVIYNIFIKPNENASDSGSKIIYGLVVLLFLGLSCLFIKEVYKSFFKGEE